MDQPKNSSYRTTYEAKEAKTKEDKSLSYRSACLPGVSRPTVAVAPHSRKHQLNVTRPAFRNVSEGYISEDGRKVRSYTPRKLLLVGWSDTGIESSTDTPSQNTSMHRRCGNLCRSQIRPNH